MSAPGTAPPESPFRRLLARPPLYPPFYLLLSAALMLALDRWLPLREVVPAVWRRLGLLPLGAGLLLILWCAGLFRRAGTTIKPFQRSSALLRRGPYRYSRNPIYLGMLAVLAGIGVLLGTLAPFSVVPLFALWIDFGFIRAEEAALADTFGAAYAAYCRQVRRWL